MVLRQGALTIDPRTGVDGWQKALLLGALVFLPVPVLTATGLAVPIPSLVYQVAAGLASRTQGIVVQLPGFQGVAAETHAEAREGVIRRSAAELAVGATPTQISASHGRATGTAAKTDSTKPSARASRPHIKTPVGGGGSSGAASPARNPSPGSGILAEDTPATTPPPPFLPPAPVALPPPPPPVSLPAPPVEAPTIPVTPPQAPHTPPGQVHAPTLPPQAKAASHRPSTP